MSPASYLKLAWVLCMRKHRKGSLEQKCDGARSPYVKRVFAPCNFPGRELYFSGAERSAGHFCVGYFRKQIANSQVLRLEPRLAPSCADVPDADWRALHAGNGK